MNAADLAPLVLRLVVGGIFIAHGYAKTLAAPGATHGRASLTSSIARAGLPRAPVLAWIVGATELVGGICVLVGVFTVVASAALSLVLLVAIVRFKLRAGFVGGWDWPFACLGATVALMLLGAGPLSLDALAR